MECADWSSIVRRHREKCSKNFEFVIAGQGLAGSILAWYLIKSNRKVLVVEDSSLPSATSVASGLMHPVTGRRIVKSWRADEFIPNAVKLYRDIEKELNTRFFYDTPILEIYHDHGNRNGQSVSTFHGRRFLEIKNDKDASQIQCAVH